MVYLIYKWISHEGALEGSIGSIVIIWLVVHGCRYNSDSIWVGGESRVASWDMGSFSLPQRNYFKNHNCLNKWNHFHQLNSINSYGKIGPGRLDLLFLNSMCCVV